jgi:EAL and modified HD-GYP domain-containing signal transduction protein
MADFSVTVGAQVFVARQPIFDRSRRVFAYELLFRESEHVGSAGTQSDQASARVITDAALTIGLEALTRGRPAFINMSRRLLLDGLAESLPPGQVVLELLENIEGDDEVIAACHELRRAGYAIALDDFVLNAGTERLVPLADYIKIDVLHPFAAETRRAITECPPANRPALLAEKIETARAFGTAFDEGYSYFQGFFFGRPETSTGHNIAPDRLSHVRLLQALQDPDLTVHRLEALIRHDVALCYRVLRTINSAAYAQTRQIESITHALVLMGVETVRRWASLWALAGITGDSHPELIVMSTVRARCCELLAMKQVGPAAGPEGFLLGMCSLLDVILKRPMAEVLRLLPLSPATHAALAGEDTGNRRLLDCVVAYERAEWSRLLELGVRAGIAVEDVRAAHADAIRWSAEVPDL